MKTIKKEIWTEEEVKAYFRATKEWRNKNVFLQKVVKTKTVQQIKAFSYKLKQLSKHRRI